MGQGSTSRFIKSLFLLASKVGKQKSVQPVFFYGRTGIVGYDKPAQLSCLPGVCARCNRWCGNIRPLLFFTGSGNAEH
jgi:hypothetical protein